MRKIKVSQEKLAEILRKYANGVHTWEIAKEYEIDADLITKYARNAGVSRPDGYNTIWKPRCRNLLESDLHNIRKEYEAGLPVSDIAEKYDLSQKLVRKYVKVLGAQRPSRPLPSNRQEDGYEFGTTFLHDCKRLMRLLEENKRTE